MTTQPHIDTHLNAQALTDLHAHVQDKYAALLLSSSLAVRELTLRTTPEHVVSLLTRLRDDKKTQFAMLVDLCGVDWLDGRPEQGVTERFDVVYHLLSVSKNLRLRICVAVDDGQSVPSAIDVYPNANWYERETWDLFGIPFLGHPDLRRILTDYDFNGHPLRKDFPLEGFVETYYDTAEKRVAYKPVDLPQEFRRFDKTSPWQAMTGNATLAETDNRVTTRANNFNPEEFK